MRKTSANKLLDQTIAFTTSSTQYYDPYRPRGNPLYKVQNKVKNFIGVRTFENEFVDYDYMKMDVHFNKIYADLQAAYRRRDKVILSRSLSSQMLHYNTALVKKNAASPYCKDVNYS